MVRLSLRPLSFSRANVPEELSPDELSPDAMKREHALNLVARVNGTEALTMTPPLATPAPVAECGKSLAVESAPITPSLATVMEPSDITIASPQPEERARSNELLSPASPASWSTGLHRAAAGLSQFTGQSLVACLYTSQEPVTPAPKPRAVVRVLGVEPRVGKDGITHYVISLQRGVQQWTSTHRYREWHALYQSLPERLTTPFPPKLPPPALCAALCLGCGPTEDVAGLPSDDVTSTRAVALHLWAQELCLRWEFRGPEEAAIGAFLKLPAGDCERVTSLPGKRHAVPWPTPPEGRPDAFRVDAAVKAPTEVAPRVTAHSVTAINM